MSDLKPESGLNFNFIMPVALLLVLLIVPFSINGLMHYLSSQKQLNPLIMKIPIDSDAIRFPANVKQYEGFEVALNLDTQRLARFLNEINAMASEGTSIQGIVGSVSPNMQADIVGDDFIIDRVGPPGQTSGITSEAQWKWYVTPQSSGNQSLTFHLHLSTLHKGQQYNKILDLAEAHFAVQSNSTEWFKRNWIWMVLVLLTPVAALFALRRRYSHQND